MRVVLFLSMWAALSQANAATFPFEPELEQTGWRAIPVSGQPENMFEVDDAGSLIIRSQGSVSFLATEVPANMDGSLLTWEWRVDQGFPARNLTTPGEDDRPLALHVWFPSQSKDLFSWFGSGVKNLFGVPTVGKAITYMWGAEEDAGTVIANPFMDDGEGVLINLRHANTDTGVWFSETVNLADDYRRVFGEASPTPAYIAISADTDDTKQTSVARVRRIKLSGND